MLQFRLSDDYLGVVMSRLKIVIPRPFTFSTQLSVRITDLNYGNHLGNDALLRLIHEARVQFLDSLGYSEKDIEGRGIVLTDAALVYKQEAFWKDLLEIHISVGDWSKIGCNLYYWVTCQQKEVARVKTQITFFDYQTRSLTSLPEEFLKTVKNLERNRNAIP